MTACSSCGRDRHDGYDRDAWADKCPWCCYAGRHWTPACTDAARRLAELGTSDAVALRERLALACGKIEQCQRHSSYLQKELKAAEERIRGLGGDIT